MVIRVGRETVWNMPAAGWVEQSTGRRALDLAGGLGQPRRAGVWCEEAATSSLAERRLSSTLRGFSETGDEYVA